MSIQITWVMPPPFGLSAGPKIVVWLLDVWVCAFSKSWYSASTSLPFTPCVYGVKIYPTTHCACRKRRLSSFGTISARRGCNNQEPPPSPLPPLVGAQGYQRFPHSKHVVDRKIALYAVPAYQGFYLPSFCLTDSFRFILSNFFQSSTVECVLNSECEFLLVVGIHCVLPWYDHSRLI